jgi:hypothetical protein
VGIRTGTPVAVLQADGMELRMSTKASDSAGSPPVTVTGRITPAAWDRWEVVSEVMLEWESEHAEDPCELLIHGDGESRLLLHFVGRIATVTGTVTQNEDGEPVLVVSSFRLHHPRRGGRLAS